MGGNLPCGTYKFPEPHTKKEPDSNFSFFFLIKDWFCKLEIKSRITMSASVIELSLISFLVNAAILLQYYYIILGKPIRLSQYHKWKSSMLLPWCDLLLEWLPESRWMWKLSVPTCRLLKQRPIKARTINVIRPRSSTAIYRA